MDSFQILSFNAEGLSAAKIEILANLRPDILCLQETHKEQTIPDIPGMNLIVHHGSPVHGSAIYARDTSIVTNSQDISADGLEILKIETRHLNIVTVYKPPPTPFKWPESLHGNTKPTIIVGDFNSHNTAWGYSTNNPDGEAVEDWAINHDLSLLHCAKDESSFASARWKKGYNPDLAFVSSNHFSSFSTTIGNAIPRSQHRPLII